MLGHAEARVGAPACPPLGSQRRRGACHETIIWGYALASALDISLLRFGQREELWTCLLVCT